MATATSDMIAWFLVLKFTCGSYLFFLPNYRNGKIAAPKL